MATTRPDPGGPRGARNLQLLRAGRPAPACVLTTPAAHPAPARSPSRPQPRSEALSHQVLHTPWSPRRLAALRVHQPRPPPSGLGDTPLPSQWGGSGRGRLQGAAETGGLSQSPPRHCGRSFPKATEAGRRRNGEGGAGSGRGGSGNERRPAGPMGRGHGRGRGRAAAC